MAEMVVPEEFEVLEVIPLHFNVPGNHLPLREFIETASKTEAIVAAFNDELFAGQLRYDFMVLPPEAGTFKSRLAIYLRRAGYTSVAFGVIWAGLESDMGKAFVRALTDHEPAHWAEKAGKALREGVEEDVEGLDEKIKKKCTAVILSESTKGFLRKDFGELRRLGFSKEKFRDAYSARNEFYEACYRNDSIQGVGFDDSDQFPIDRKDFANFIVSLPPKPEEELDQNWIVEVAFIKVTSPNWDRQDSKRSWKGRDNRGREIFFVIEDEAFWGQVGIDRLHLHTVDELKVQWAFIEKAGRKKQLRVLRVLEFNGEKISELITDEDLPAVLSSYTYREDDQSDLFDGYPLPSKNIEPTRHFWSRLRGSFDCRSRPRTVQMRPFTTHRVHAILALLMETQRWWIQKSRRRSSVASRASPS